MFSGTVTSVERQSDRCRVRVAGAVPLTAEVTPAALEELGIVDGARVWASFKAMEVLSYPA
ncbi:TOBE domain protein [compost metagenome]